MENRICEWGKWILCLSLLALVSRNCFASGPNVLLIAIDDLRPELGCYGAAHVHSPNIDKFAASARLFERAYCQQAVCNPSRTSLMTGMRPDTIGVTGNHVHFRDRHPDVITLPQHFMQHGYHTAAIGKIYHGVFPDGASATQWDTMGDPASWSVPALRFGPRYYFTEDGIEAAQRVYQQIYKPKNPGPDDWTEKLVFGPATESPQVDDSVLYDGKVADAAIERLQTLSRSENPFFLAVGFIKPHSPYIAPKKYFDLYSDVALATQPLFPIDAPRFAGHGSGELRRYTDQPKQGAISPDRQRRVRHAYLACVSFIDAQVGRVLDSLEQLGLAENTIVVLYGDHGYHLGEQGLWGKTTNFELDTRVPLIVRAPQLKSAGKATDAIVELVDLYPTLAELAGLPVSDQLEGKSFGPVLDDPRAEGKPGALSQYPRGGMMGYSWRNATHRLTQWIDRQSGEVRATELYDYSDRLIESQNIAVSASTLVEQMSQQLQALIAVPAPSTVQLPSKIDDSHPDSRAFCGFESSRAGTFEELKTELGVWKLHAGRALVDRQHAKSGRQCLQLTGGDETSVTLRLAPDVATDGVLSFWAERWTKRLPFSFRVDKRTSDPTLGWQEIYNGDQVRVGRAFLNQVSIPLHDDSITQLRFRVTSPANTGVLLDDLQIATPRPQQITSVEVVPTTLPALIGADRSPLMQLRVDTTGNLNPISLTDISLSFQGQAQMEAVYASLGEQYTEYQQSLTSELNGPESDGPDSDGPQLAWKIEGLKLEEGENVIWIGCRLKDTAEMDHPIGVALERVTFSNSRSFTIQAKSSQRTGVVVRDGGDDGVHTYRIPGLVTTNQGTLIGVYDTRWRSAGDLPGDIDVGMSRSTDGGRTWEPMKIVMDMGDDPNWRYDGVGDPAILVDRRTGTIWIAATWSHGDRSWFGSGPGRTPEETGQLMLVKSEDDGVTWSKPINITNQVKRPEWCFLLQGPGKGITMRDGTLVFAAQYQDPPHASDKVANRRPHSTIIFSQDHGQTWQVGSGAFDDTTEAQVVEVEPGVLMLNCRYNRESTRVVMTTDDLGQTWKTHSTSRRSLIEPRACMGSLIDTPIRTGSIADDWLLFSNPNSTRGRDHITIKASPDRGLSWPKQHRLLLDEGAGRGYSCMTMIDENTVGILYESSQADLAFQRVPLSDIVDEELEKATVSEEEQASLQLPSVFGSHMVLQAGLQIPVWGQTLPGAEVRVCLAEESQTTRANAQGHWMVHLAEREASSRALNLSVFSAGKEIVFDDVVVGEVWVCAGQSNMAWPLRLSDNGPAELEDLARQSALASLRSSSEVPNPAPIAAQQTQIRLLHLVGGATGRSGAYTARHLERLRDEVFCQGSWQVASAESAREFSAVSWYFGKSLQQRLDVPVGLICPAVGGTPTEAWIPQEALAADPNLKGLVTGNWLDNPRLGEFCRTRGAQNLVAAMQAGELIPGDELGPNHSFKPGFMWRAGIEPLLPFAIRGAIWYQGESNAESLSRAQEHSQLFPLLIQHWRSRWGQGEFPFLFVQLPAMDRAEWPWFRDGQRRILDHVDNVGMAITIDHGHPTNVHPSLKKPVGERLARWALAKTKPSASNEPVSGPLLKSTERSIHSVTLTFGHVGKGLESADGRPLRHFEVCGAEGVYRKGLAKLVDAQHVVVSHPLVPNPQHVRYTWVPYPSPPVNLVNSAGLPASPFSTESEAATYDWRVNDTRLNDTLGEQHDRRDHRPNILLIVSEDNGPELSCYDDAFARTPHLDRLAAEGVRFETAYVTQSVCSPSRGTIFTGLYPHQNGQIGLATHQFEMFREWPTTYSILKAAGYRTGLIGKTHVNPPEVIERHVDFRRIPSSNFAKKKLDEYAKESATFINASNEPFFLTVNFPDAHWPVQNQVEGRPQDVVGREQVGPMPYIGFDNERLRGHLAGFYNCMSRLDECVGELLAELDRSGKADNTLVVYIGDHGAQFARGKVFVTEGGLRIPFIVRWPGKAQPGLVSNQMVSTLDLLPTFVAAAEAEVPKYVPGLDLADVLRGESARLREYLFAERNCDSADLHFPQRAIRDTRYKLIKTLLSDRPDPGAHKCLVNGASNFRGSPTYAELESASERTRAAYRVWLNPPEYQLYDLKHDRHEFHNLADDPELQEVKQRLIKRLEQWQVETDDRLRFAELVTRLTEENDACRRSQIRSPKGGWKYLDYLAPELARSQPYNGIPAR